MIEALYFLVLMLSLYFDYDYFEKIQAIIYIISPITQIRYIKNQDKKYKNLKSYKKIILCYGTNLLIIFDARK